MNQLWNSFKIAFSMYSRIPVPGSEWTKEHMKYTLCFFPAVGVIVGLLVICWSDFSRFLDFGMPARTAGLTLIPVIVTGGIHMDGFMDTADALGSFRGKEKKLLILKDPHWVSICRSFMCVLFSGIWRCRQRDRERKSSDPCLGICAVAGVECIFYRLFSHGKRNRACGILLRGCP